MQFIERLFAAVRRVQNPVVVGIDPRPEDLPDGFLDRFPNDRAGVAQATGWHTGLPMRTGFARGRPEHDPWRFDASRLVESGEADAAVWVGGLDADVPSWIGKVPTVALDAPDTRFPVAPAIRINVGCPAIDHDAVLFDARLGVLAVSRARAASKVPRAADVLRGITFALTSPC